MTKITLRYYYYDGSGDDVEYGMELEGEEEAAYIKALETIRNKSTEDDYTSLNDFQELRPILDRALKNIIEIETEIALSGGTGMDEEDIPEYIENLPYDTRVEFVDEEQVLHENDQECVNCGEIIADGEGEMFRGEWYCDGCYDELTATCDICGKTVLAEELRFWGDNQICKDCMEERAPSFDKDENFKETEPAYLAMKQRYVGKKTEDLAQGEHGFSYSITTDETDICYNISVIIDSDGIITDVSPLTAEILLSEGTTSSEWEPYPIDSDDYDWLADEILQDGICFVDEDDEDFEEDNSSD